MAAHYSFGKTSPKTEKIRYLVNQVTALGVKSDVTNEDLQAVLSSINNEYLSYDDVFVSAAFSLLSQVIEDGIISEEERSLLVSFSDLYTNPVKDEPVTDISGKRFVLTGDFSVEGGKNTVKEMIISEGGKVTGSVSGKTNYVVVGELGSDAWGYGSFGSKIKKAIDLKLSKRLDIKIISEKALIQSFELSSTKAIEVLKTKKERFNKQWASAKTVSPSFRGLTKGQEEAFKLVKSGENVYLAGLGGTGKSYLLEKIIRWARGLDKNVLISAPTGIAALNIGGSTIHRVLGIRPDATLEIKSNPWVDRDSLLYACDLMIVDEISMCRLDLFDYLSKALEKAALLRAEDDLPKCQLLVVGDFGQLPPVVTKEDRQALNKKYGKDIDSGYAFLGSEWHKWNFKFIELTEAIRQRNADFVAALNACRVGDTKGVEWIEGHCLKEPLPESIILCGTNLKAEEENNNNLKKIKEPEYTYEAVISGKVEKSEYPTMVHLALKKGARVMSLVNHPTEKYMNGSLGTVAECGEDAAVVEFDNGNICRLGFHKWEIIKPQLAESKIQYETVGAFEQLPLKLAYAITIHKAQGQTFEKALIYPDCWDPGQLYTALSRLTNIDGLCLAYSCRDDSLRVSDKVLEFYSELENQNRNERET